MATPNQIQAAQAAAMVVARAHNVTMFITEAKAQALATELVKAVIDAYEANAPDPPKAAA